MQRIEATFGGISLGSGREFAKIPPHFLLTAVSAAAILSLSWVGARLIAHKFPAEAVVAVPAAHHAAPPAEAPADFGAMIVEPEWVAKPASPNIDYSSVASLEAAPSANIPLPSLEAFPLEPSAKAVPRPPAASLGKATSQPPGSEVARLENACLCLRRARLGLASLLQPPRRLSPSRPRLRRRSKIAISSRS